MTDNILVPAKLACQSDDQLQSTGAAAQDQDVVCHFSGIRGAIPC